MTHSDGSQEVVTLLNDLGVQPGDKREIINRLREQGVDVMAILASPIRRAQQPLSRLLPD